MKSQIIKTFVLAILSTLFTCTVKAIDVTMPMTTLQHGDAVSVFYGENSFVEAYNAAESGDQIALSKGTYNSNITITKAVKIYGADWNNTNFSNEVKLQLADGEEGFEAEGIRFGRGLVASATVAKCSFRKSYFNSQLNFADAETTNCPYRTMSYQLPIFRFQM